MSNECGYVDLRTDGINWGYNRGGCFICEVSTEGEWLSDTALAAACEQTCSADPSCIAYEYAHLAFHSFLKFRGSGNCCLAYDDANESVPVYAPRGFGNNCEKEANCWNRVEKNDTTCNDVMQPHPICRQIYEWNDSDLHLQTNLVQNGCIPEDLSFLGSDEEVVYQKRLDTAAPKCVPSEDSSPAPTSNKESSPIEPAESHAAPSLLRSSSIVRWDSLLFVGIVWKLITK